jgi:hypothetical protein
MIHDLVIALDYMDEWYIHYRSLLVYLVMTLGTRKYVNNITYSRVTPPLDRISF